MRILTTRFSLLLLLAFAFQAQGFAAAVELRWTGKDDANAGLSHVLDQIAARSGVKLAPQDLKSVEERELAHERFQMFVQLAAGVRVKGTALRIWKDSKTDQTIQI